MYCASYASIIRSDIESSNETASKKVMWLNGGASSMDIGTEVLSEFVVDLLGRTSLESALFRRFFSEE